MKVAQANPPAPAAMQASRLRPAPEEVLLGDDCIAMAMTYFSF